MSKIITVMSTLALGIVAQQSFAQGKECDMTGLRSNKSVSCEITGSATNGMPGRAKAVINVERVKVNKASDEINPTKPDEEVEVFRMSVGGEYDCETCLIHARTERSILSPEVKEFRTFKDLAAFVMNEGNKKMAEATKLGKDERDRKENEELCLVVDGQKLIGKERMDCRVKNLKAMDSDKATDYFHKYVKGDLQALLQSNNPQDQAAAMDYLLKMNAESKNDNIKLSLNDLYKYGQYNKEQTKMLNQISTMSPTDQNRHAPLQALEMLKNDWTGYFQSRGFDTNTPNQQFANYYIQSMINEDVAQYRRELDTRYNSITDQYRVNYPPANQNSMAQAQMQGAGRLTRGMTNGYLGAPAATSNQMMPSQQQPNYYQGQQQPNYYQGQQQNPYAQRPTGVNGLPTSPQMGPSRPGFGKPMLGQPVR